MVLLLVCVGLLLGGVELATADSAAHRARAARAPAQAVSQHMCGLRSNHGTYQHVIVLFEENHSYGTIYHSSSAPYINSVINSCGLATNYHNITHHSLPEYLAATTGASLVQLEPYVSDCTPSPACEWSADNIFNQVNQKNLKWRDYAESMPTPCGQSNSGDYAPRHNPAVYDTDLANCTANDIPLGTTSNSPLLKDFSSSSKAPAFAWVTPNLCHDMHGSAPGCSSNLILAADKWLKLWLPKIISTPVYRAGHTAIFITWDEGSGGTKGEDCAAHASDQSCHVVAMVVAPSVKPGKRVSTLFNHYSLLGSVEQLLGLPRLGQAASAANMLNAFNL
jgi:hypothetical protein